MREDLQNLSNELQGILHGFCDDGILEHWLKIKLTQEDNCSISVVDSTLYEYLGDVTEVGILEYLEDFDEEISNLKLTIIKNKEDYRYMRCSDPIELPGDGRFTYYKIIIPPMSAFKTTNGYDVKNKFFIYDGALWYSTTNLLLDFDIHDIEAINDPKYVWENKTESNEMFWFSETFFSICKLEKCLIELQKQFIKDNAKNCADRRCETSSDLRFKVEFLLSSIFVLKYLIRHNRFVEAQYIINDLSSCGSLCADLLKDKTSCGCGRTVR